MISVIAAETVVGRESTAPSRAGASPTTTPGSRSPTWRPGSSLLLWTLLFAPLVVTAQTPPEPFAERLEVRETSVVARPPASKTPAGAAGAVTVTVAGLEQRVTRVEGLGSDDRGDGQFVLSGDWRFVVYLDPRLAGARTRFLATLALSQRAEALAALGTVEVVDAEVERPGSGPVEGWQGIEATLLEHALAAKLELERRAAAVERPAWSLFHERLERLRKALAKRGSDGPRALLVLSDGIDSAPESEVLNELARNLAGSGWVTLPMPWKEQPAEISGPRLSHFERWREAAEGRDVSAGQRRYVIDFGRVVRHLRGAADSPTVPRAEPDPGLAALQALARPTSGWLVAGDAELDAALADLARRWRIWFQVREPGDGTLRPLEVRLDGEPLDAPGWILSPAER